MWIWVCHLSVIRAINKSIKKPPNKSHTVCCCGCDTAHCCVQGDNCHPPLSKHRLSTLYFIAAMLIYTVWGLLRLTLQVLALPPALWTNRVEQYRSSQLCLQNHRLSGNGLPFIPLIPKNTEYSHPPRCHLPATFVQVFIFLRKRCQAHVLVRRESVAVQTVRPGVPVAGEHGAAAVTDGDTHAPTRMDEPVTGGITRLNQCNSLRDNRNYCNSAFCAKHIVFTDTSDPPIMI